MKGREPAANAWSKIREWHYVLPPSRPSVYHLEIVRHEIRRIDRNLPIAVLGSTPEFRDLLALMGFKDVFVLEKSPDRYREMNALRGCSQKDKLILGDWLDLLPRCRGIFAAILSDLTSGNISYDDQPRFYRAVAESLRDEGVFIDKILIHRKKKRPLESLERKYERLPVNLLSTNYFSCEFLFCSELLDLKQLVDTTLFYDILERRFKSEVLLKFLHEAPRITPYGATWFYGKEWKLLRQSYFKNLSQIRRYDEEAGSPYHGNLKILINRQKTDPK